jgi:hypothetical protein
MKLALIALLGSLATYANALQVDPEVFFALSDPIRGGYRYGLTREKCPAPVTGVGAALVKRFDLISDKKTGTQGWKDATVAHPQYGQFATCWTEVTASTKARAVLACSIAANQLGSNCVLLGWDMFIDTRTLPPAPRRLSPSN